MALKFQTVLDEIWIFNAGGFVKEDVQLKPVQPLNLLDLFALSWDLLDVFQRSDLLQVQSPANHNCVFSPGFDWTQSPELIFVPKINLTQSKNFLTVWGS